MRVVEPPSTAPVVNLTTSRNICVTRELGKPTILRTSSRTSCFIHTVSSPLLPRPPSVLSVFAKSFVPASNNVSAIVPPRLPLALSATAKLFVPASEPASSPVPPSPHAVAVIAAPPSSRVLLPTRHHQHEYDLDRLDAHIEHAAAAFKASGSWGDFVRSIRGRGDLHPDVGTLPHPAAHLLSRFQKCGTPAIIQSSPWTPERIEAALKRGPHQSSARGIEFLRNEYADMMDKQQWTVLPAHLVQSLFGLRLSPIGLVPQRGRRDRMISDYTYFGVNAETLQLAPLDAMQFGRTLHRLLSHIHRANDHFGPVYMSKIDLSDGFYRLWLKPEDTLRLAVLFPSRTGEPPLIGIPLTNPMGWCSSPPNFSACTETVADLANAALADPSAVAAARQAPHRLDVLSESTPIASPVPTPSHPSCAPATLPITIPSSPPVSSPYKKPVSYWDIYVDDFCGLAQGNEWRRRVVKRLLFRSLDKVFRPLDSADTPFRQEPASLKKLQKGDATWTTSKVILGWLLDTVAKTITLPPHRVERLHEILASIRPEQRVVLKKDWHKVLGELRSMSIALPGSQGLFSLLQEAFRHEELDRPRLRLSKMVHGFLDDFRWLATDIASRPTRIAELIPDPLPSTLGACDAAGTGMGGVHFVPDEHGNIVPLLWRQPFPPWVRDRLVSFKNPDGDITNSDLELAGSIAQHDILAQAADIAERTIHNSYDNTAAVYWQRKGSTTTTGPAAFLLRLQALHQRYFRYVPLRDYIPGPDNVMADLLSRAWHLTDAQLISHFNTHFPQTTQWRLCRLRKQMNSNLISSLSRRRCDRESLMHTPTGRIPIGRFGATSVNLNASTRSSEIRSTRSRICKSLEPATKMVVSHPAVNPSHLARYRTPCVQWGRNSPAWGPAIHG